MYFKSVVFCQNKAHSFEFNFVLCIIVYFDGAVNWFEVAPAGCLVGEGWCFLGVCVINVVYILHFVW